MKAFGIYKNQKVSRLHLAIISAPSFSLYYFESPTGSGTDEASMYFVGKKENL
jgi:hypothetical protein